MRLALWTPRPAHGWLGGVLPELERTVSLAVVASEPDPRPDVDLDLYHVANDVAHGFVYRALRERPGLVLLEEWALHALVFAETAGRGDTDGYRREARRSRGPTGEFVARQVLRGLGGELPSLLPLNDRVLEACLALVARREGDLPLAQAALGGRRVVHLPFDRGAVEEDALALVALAREAAPRLDAALQAARRSRALEDTALGRALGELRPFARELGLTELGPGVVARVAPVFRGPDRASEG